MINSKNQVWASTNPYPLRKHLQNIGCLQRWICVLFNAPQSVVSQGSNNVGLWLISCFHSWVNSCVIWFSNSCALVKDTCVTCGVGYILYHLLLLWVLSLVPVSLLVGLKVFYFFIVAGYFSAGWVNWAALLWGHEIASFGGKTSRDAKQEGSRGGDPRTALFYGLWSLVIWSHLWNFILSLCIPELIY